jgi:hypothetical protein
MRFWAVAGAVLFLVACHGFPHHAAGSRRPPKSIQPSPPGLTAEQRAERVQQGMREAARNVRLALDGAVELEKNLEAHLKAPDGRAVVLAKVTEINRLLSEARRQYLEIELDSDQQVAIARRLRAMSECQALLQSCVDTLSKPF